MAMKKWVIGKPDTAKAKLMADELEIDPFVALIAYVRGITDSSELEQLICTEPLLADPREIADITVAADIINAAIEAKDKIAVYGDYDCDGVVSTALMYDYLIGRGADVEVYIPDRLKEGYGLNISAIDILNARGVKVIITVDNGISSVEEIEYANTLGITTVITDHHIPPEVLPDAAVIVDPHRNDCVCGFKEICGAMVAFKLCCVLEDKEPEQMLNRYADILAIATVGDVMPIINENRSVVRVGIEKIRRNPRVGISAILNSAGVDRDSVTSSKISFGITPRINAAGRMGSAMRAFDLLICKDMLKALKIAEEIDNDNLSRQKIEHEISEAAFKTIEENGFNYNRVIVVSGNNWHTGVTGIVASRICEKYGKPAIVLSCGEDGFAHGSGRSFEGFNLFDAILNSNKALTRFGGHALAAGVSIRNGDIDKFRNDINGYAAKLPYAVPELPIDFKLNPAGLSVDMAHALKVLEPFGNGNPAPVFAICNVKLERINELSGGKHLKLFFSRGDNMFAAILFGVGTDKFCFETGQTLDIAVSLEANYFRGEYNLSLFIKAIRLSGTDDEEVFRAKASADDFLSGGEYSPDALLPTREEIGEIYKAIKQKELTEEKIRYMFLNTVGYAKTQIALTVLSELSLIKRENDVFCAAKSEKTDLAASRTFRLLSGGAAFEQC